MTSAGAGTPTGFRVHPAAPTVDFHGHLAVPAADALCTGTDGLAAELAAEQRAHSPPPSPSTRNNCGDWHRS